VGSSFFSQGPVVITKQLEKWTSKGNQGPKWGVDLVPFSLICFEGVKLGWIVTRTVTLCKYNSMHFLLFVSLAKVFLTSYI
jgi:hypothetical protein